MVELHVMDAGRDIRMSHDECERHVREGSVGVEREVKVVEMLHHVMFLSAKNGGLDKILAVKSQLVVRDSSGQTGFSFVSWEQAKLFVEEV